MIRVLQIIDHLGSGGAQTVLLNLLKHRDTARFEHTVASMHGLGPMAGEFTAIGVRVVSLSPRKWPPLYLSSLWRLLRTGDFDIVHCHLFGANWIARPLARLLGCRVIFTHDHCCDAMRENPFFRAIDTITNRLATRILAVSRSTRDFLIRREGLSPGRVEYFPNGVDIQAFSSPSPEARASARRMWHLPGKGLIIGGVGRLVPQKDFAVFLEAAAIVLRTHPDVHFAIFGDGPEEAALKSRASFLGISEQVLFLGYVKERAAIYAAIDVMFLTSLYEGTPMVLLEAMAAGVPIVASAVDGTAEILQDGSNAALFPAADPAAAALALSGLIMDSARRASFPIVASDTVRERYDASVLAARLEALYVSSTHSPEKLVVAENSGADTRGAHR